MRDPDALPAAPPTHESRLLPYLGLFSSVGTLLCCALPSLLVLLGFGATVASALSLFPWLVTLSRHKVWVFGASALLLAANFHYVYRVAPGLLAARGACPAEEREACARATRFSRLVLWLATALYAAGFTVAYALPLLLQWLDA